MPTLDYDFQSSSSSSSSSSPSGDRQRRAVSPVSHGLVSGSPSKTPPSDKRSNNDPAPVITRCRLSSGEKRVAKRTDQIRRDGLALQQQARGRSGPVGRPVAAAKKKAVALANLFPRLNQNFKIPRSSKASSHNQVGSFLLSFEQYW